MRTLPRAFSWIVFLLFLVSFTSTTAQDHQTPEVDKDLILSVAREMTKSLKFCALITLDETGQPQARTMQPFPPEENMTIWFGTNNKSRKVNQVKNDPRATVYYADPTGDGYVVLTGQAFIVDDAEEKEKRWMDNWDEYYPDKDETYTLIKFVPELVEVVSYKYGLIGDQNTWRAPNTTLVQD